VLSEEECQQSSYLLTRGIAQLSLTAGLGCDTGVGTGGAAGDLVGAAVVRAGAVVDRGAVTLP
jgi:hypothetical protein